MKILYCVFYYIYRFTAIKQPFMHRKKFLNIFFIFCFGFLLVSCFSKDPKKSAKEAPAHLHTVDANFDSLSPYKASAYTAAIEQYYNEHLEKGFNGAILVAKNGQVLFEQYKGYANFITKDSINEHTPFHLASISKTFTGMAVLKLWEEGNYHIMVLRYGCC